MNVTRRTLLKWGAGTAAVAGGAYGLSRAGMLDFLDADRADKNPVQVKRKPYPAEPGRQLSMLGFGCMRFPILGQDTSRIDETLSEKLIDYAYRHGVNYFDTAEMYMGGNSQAFVGKALQKYPRESFYIVDKMPGFAPFVKCLDDAKRIFQAQLDKCRTAYFDNYLCHSLRDIASFKEVYERCGVLDYLKSERDKGRIRHLGFSFHGDTKDLEYYLGLGGWDCVQLMINCIDWNDKDGKNSSVAEGIGFAWGKIQPAGTHYRMAEAARLPILVMEPLRGGRLVTLNSSATRRLREAEPGASVASWGLRFVASLPAVAVTLSGMSRFSDVIDNVKTMADFRPMTDGERKTLAAALEDFKKQKTISCTACRYCMPCKYGIDIPGVFKVFNDAAGEGELGPNGDGAGISDALKQKFLVCYNNSVAPLANASHCIGCGKCKRSCPQGLDIPKEMQKIEDLVTNLQSGLKRRGLKGEEARRA
jgi:predicted aldo/keto reductase-like oxidoreductase